MILELENWYLGYSQILTDCRTPLSDGGASAAASSSRFATSGSVLILCHPDVDALAAARILTYMLRNDGISYQLLPCTSYCHLRRLLQQQRGGSSSNSNSGNPNSGDDFDDSNGNDDNNDHDALADTERSNDHRAIVLLNMGAGRNLTRLFVAESLVTTTTEDDDGDPIPVGMSQPPLLEASSTKVYVMDCRRPVHLANVYAGENVVVFWDRTMAVDEVPSDGDNLSGHSSSDDDDNEEDDSERRSNHDEESSDRDDASFDGEHEFEMEGNENEHAPRAESTPPLPYAGGGTSEDDDYDADREYEDHLDDAVPSKGAPKRRRLIRHRLTDNDDEDRSIEPNDDDSNSHDSGLTKGPADGIPASATAATEDSEVDDAGSLTPPLTANMTPRQVHEDRNRRLHRYYSQGSFYGSPAAYKVYRVATQLRFGDVGDLLWLACVGVTDAYVHARLDVAGYTALAMDLRGSCQRLYPSDLYHRVGHAVYAEHLTGDNGAFGSNNDGDLTKIRFSEQGRILSESDFRFFLLRHTSLFDAMKYSDFISTKFQLSTRGGMLKLQEMLAKMGLPLEECKQPFAFMKPSLRRKLQDKFREYAEEYGLENFEFTSFFRITGYQSLLSASDTSYAASALLECENGLTSTSLYQTDDELLVQSFNAAFDAINVNATSSSSLELPSGSTLGGIVNGSNLGGSSGLGAGLRLAMLLQANIVAMADNLVAQSLITRLSHFRYAYITVTSRGENSGASGIDIDAMEHHDDEEAPGQEQHNVFAKPLALTRLAHYLMDLHRENGKWTGNKARPLILLAEKPRTESFLVVGYEYPEYAGHFVKNRFGKNFELAAQSMDLQFRTESFDSNAVEIDARNVQRFLEQLHYLLDEL